MIVDFIARFCSNGFFRTTVVTQKKTTNLSNLLSFSVVCNLSKEMSFGQRAK